MELSIIFVNWNSTDYLRESVASIYMYTSGLEFEIIIIDNASPAGDVDMLKEQFPAVKLIKSEENLGFAGANNLGFRASSGAHILFLNPDTKLTHSAINVMLHHLASLPAAGVVGCRLLNGDLSLQTSCIQSFPTILNQALDAEVLRGRWPNSSLWGIAPLYAEKSEPARVEVISGACMMTRRDVFERVGMFSVDYFMYAEDLDLSYKMVVAGYSNYFIGDATIIHYGGVSSTPQSAVVMKWTSILQYCVKNHGRLYAAIFRSVMIVVALIRLVLIAARPRSGKTSLETQGRYSAWAKWRAVLKTLLTASNASQNKQLGKALTIES